MARIESGAYRLVVAVLVLVSFIALPMIGVPLYGAVVGYNPDWLMVLLFDIPLAGVWLLLFWAWHARHSCRSQTIIQMRPR